MHPAMPIERVFRYNKRKQWYSMFRLASFFSVLIAAAVMAGPSLSQSSIPIDSTFTVTTFGKPRKVGGVPFYSVVTFHKVIERKGRAYVCMGFASLLLRGGGSQKHSSRAKIVSSKGNVIKSGLTGWTDLMPYVQLSGAQREAMEWGTAADGLKAYPSFPAFYKGAPASCKKAKKRSSPDFYDGESRIVLGDEIGQFAENWLK